MSSIWKKPTFSLRQLELHWQNNCWNTHDLFCHCDQPWLHMMILINKGGKAPKPESEIKNILCLLTGEGASTTATEEDDPGFLNGELEKLFEENTQDDGPTEDGTR